MKKVIFSLVLCMFLTVFSCGCGDGNPGSQNVSGEQGAFSESVDFGEESPAVAEDHFFEELLLEEEEWRDNTLDDYTAVASLSLHCENLEGEIGGGRETALGNTCGAALSKHLLATAEDSWDELRIATDQGETASVRLAFFPDRSSQTFGLGGMVGSDHFLMYLFEYVTKENSEEEGFQYYFFETDGEQLLRTIPVDFLSDDGNESPSSIMADKSGNIHFTTTSMSTDPDAHNAVTHQYYFIMDSEGTLLAKYEYAADIIPELVSLYDGRVALWSTLKNSEGRRTGSRLEYMDIPTGEMILLVEHGQDSPEVLWEKDNCQYTLWDDKTLLYADNRGLHLADLSGNITGDIYIWSNHGIRFSAVSKMQIREDGRINLIYEDNNREQNFLCLEPTQEKQEIQEIVLAVAPQMKNIYSSSVAEFNKKYPAYHIELRTDYNETALLTELIAGKGPVLIDTGLTGFENNKRLWTSLEGLFAGQEWEDALIPKAMELGEIDGTLYGVVTSFGLDTVVISEKEPTDWNYESFLDGIANNTSIEAVFNGQNDVWSFMARFLIHGLEDNYLLDAESGATYFDSDGFRRALQLGTAYCNESDVIEPGTPLLEGKVFCNTIYISRPEMIDLYRICYGREANYIGYPARDGSAHYIDSNSPLTIRATASAEEKAVAGVFLRMLLSRDNQLQGTGDYNFGLSVRRDVLEEQISQVNESSMPSASGFEQITLGSDYDREYDAWLIEELLKDAQPRKYFPKELNDIILEEMGQYLAGDITEDVLIERLTRRVGLYLAEQL